MTTATQDPNKKPFVYDPEAFKQADQFALDEVDGQPAQTKSLFDEAAKASLARLQNPGGTWNQDKFAEITAHYMKPVEQAAKQRTEALTAFFRARGWTDSGRDPAAQLKNLEMLNTDAAEKVYVPLTLEAMRNQDATAQADIAQAANLGNQRLQAYLQGRGQQFQEYQGQAQIAQTNQQLSQADKQIEIQVRGMQVQERQQLLSEANAAVTRATQQGDATGTYVDPVTGQSFETLQSKRDQLDRVIKLIQETGFVPTDIARESGATPGDVGGIRLSDLASSEDIAALGGTPAAGTPATGTTGASTDPLITGYISQLRSLYGEEMTADEEAQLSALWTSGSPTVTRDMQVIVNGIYERARNKATPADTGSPPADSGTPPAAGGGASNYDEQQSAYFDRAMSAGLTADEWPAMTQALASRDWATVGRIMSGAESRQSGGGQPQGGAGQPPGDGNDQGGTATRAGAQQWDINTARNYTRWSTAAAAGDEDAATSLRIMVGQMATDKPPDALLAQVGGEGQPQPQPAGPPAPQPQQPQQQVLPPEQRQAPVFTDTTGYMAIAKSIGATEKDLSDMEALLRAGNVGGAQTLLQQIDERATAVNPEPFKPSSTAVKQNPLTQKFFPPTVINAKTLGLTAAQLGGYAAGQQAIRAALSRRFTNVRPEQWDDEVVGNIFVGAA